MEKADHPVKKGNQAFLRAHNTAKVLNALRRFQELSRSDLAEVTTLDKKTISNIVTRLIEQQLIEVSPRKTKNVGRPKEMLKIRGDYALYAGLDMGGTHLSGVLIDFAGQIIAQHDIDVNNAMEPEILIKLCFYLMDNLFKKVNLTEDALSGIGIAFPGFVSAKTNNGTTSENIPKWQNIPIRQLFFDHYHLPVYVDDSSRLMALAELWFGQGRNCDNFIVADLGLGIGCGIVIDGKIFYGHSGKSGEVGHTIVDINGPKCTCGNSGCIESFAAGWALSRQASQIMLDHPDTLLHETIQTPLAPPTPRQLMLAADLGDPYCQEILRQAGSFIGIGFANAISLLNPRRLILGGRLVKDNNYIISSINETIKHNCMPEILKDVEVVVSNLDISASAWGAGIMCIISEHECDLSIDN